MEATPTPEPSSGSGSSESGGEMIFTMPAKPGQIITKEAVDLSTLKLMTPKDKKRYVRKACKGNLLSEVDVMNILETVGPGLALQFCDTIKARVIAQKKMGIKPQPFFLPITKAEHFNWNSTVFKVDPSALPFTCSLLPALREDMRKSEAKHSHDINLFLIQMPIVPVPILSGTFLHTILTGELLPVVWDSFVYIRHLMQLFYMWEDDSSACSRETFERLQREHVLRLSNLSKKWDTDLADFQQSLAEWQSAGGFPATTVPDVLLYQLEKLMYEFQISLINILEWYVLTFYLEDNQPKAGIHTAHVGPEASSGEGTVSTRVVADGIPKSYCREMMTKHIILPMNSVEVSDAARSDITENTEWIFLSRATWFYGADATASFAENGLSSIYRAPPYMGTSDGHHLVSRIGSFKNLRELYYYIAECVAPSCAEPFLKELTNHMAAKAAVAGASSSSGGGSGGSSGESGPLITLSQAMKEVPELESDMDTTLPTGDVVDMD